MDGYNCCEQGGDYYELHCDFDEMFRYGVEIGNLEVVVGRYD